MSSNNLRPERDTIVVSGYYGFNNLGDEAILEQLVSELKRLVPGRCIVVLSNTPQRTSSVYGVLSVSRWNIGELLKTLSHCKLFISGGGGLFQDVQNIKSVIYYGTCILLARFYQCPVLIYAQGLGPLNWPLSKWFTSFVFKQANVISARDDVSAKMLAQWDVRSVRTADPVWCLQSNPLPKPVEERLVEAGFSNKQHQRLRVGICLREYFALSKEMRAALLTTLASALPAGSLVLPLMLQPLQDEGITNDFAKLLLSHGLDVVQIDYAQLTLPSQWLELFRHCDLVISMRLHALIMSLNAGTPVIGIAYDPKVLRVVQEFEQPFINLLNYEQSNFKEDTVQLWLEVLKLGLENIEELGRRAALHTKAVQDLAKQNFDLLAKIITAETAKSPV